MKVKHYTDVEKRDATANGATGASLRWVLGPEDDMPNFYLRVADVEPGGKTMHHQHPYEHEVFVLEGKGELIDQDGKALALNPGTVAYVDPDEIHQFRNTGDGVLRFVCVIPKTE